jgi:hypothetical protein
VLFAGKLDCIFSVLVWAAAGAGPGTMRLATAIAAMNDTSLEPLDFFDTLHPPESH